MRFILKELYIFLMILNEWANTLTSVITKPPVDLYLTHAIIMKCIKMHMDKIHNISITEKKSGKMVIQWHSFHANNNKNGRKKNLKKNVICKYNFSFLLLIPTRYCSCRRHQCMQPKNVAHDNVEWNTHTHTYTDIKEKRRRARERIKSF